MRDAPGLPETSLLVHWFAASCCIKAANCCLSIVTKLKETSEVMIHSIVLFMNLRKKLLLLLRSFFSWLRMLIQNWLNEVDFAFA